MINVEVNGQLGEERSADTKVGLNLRFPSELGVGGLRECPTGHTIVLRLAYDTEVVVVTNGRVTRGTYAETELQFVEPSGGTEPVVALEVVHHTTRIEHSGAVGLTEAGGLVVTQGEVGKELVLPSIVCAAEEAEELVSRLAFAHVGDGSLGLVADERQTVVGATACACFKAIGGIFDTFLTSEEDEVVVFAYVELVLGRIGDGPLCAAAVATRTGNLTFTAREVLERGVGILRVDSIHTELRLEGQALDGVQRDEGVALVDNVVVRTELHGLEPVYIVEVATPNLVRILDAGVVGIVVAGILEYLRAIAVAATALLGVTVGLAVGVDDALVEAEGHPILGLCFEVGTEGIAVHVRLVVDTRIVQVRTADEVGALVATAAHGEVRLIHRRIVAEEELLPVGVGAVRLVALVVGGRDNLVLQLEVEQFAGAHQVATDAACQLAPAHLLADGHNGLLAAATLLGGDIDDTVGGTRTVDRGGGSILQRNCAFDVVGVNQSECAHFGGATINHEQGSAAGTERTCTTDGNVGSVDRAGITGSGEYLHTSHLTLESVGNVRGGLVGNGFAVHLGYATHEGTYLTGRTVTYYNCLVQHLVVIGQHNAHVACNADGLCLLTDRGNLQGFGCRGDVVQNEATVLIGGHSALSAFHTYSSADDGLALRVHNDTSHALLRRSHTY